MKNKLKQFWNEPVNRFWLTCAFGTLFILCFGAYSFFKESFNPVISLGLISVALIFEVLFLIALIINTFADTKREYLEAFQEINRDLRYAQYQKKNKNKEYKGPDWDDKEFTKIANLKDRVGTFVKASIEYQQVDFKRWKKRNLGVNLDHQSQTAQRIFWVIFFSSVSGFILWLSGWVHYLNADSLATIKIENKSFYTIPAALIGTLTAAPIIFIIWVFRDINNRVQIENARKDTNLKDFQKLSEWASGFHLPETKQTTTTKTISKTAKDVQEITKETTTSQEDFLAPEGSNSISRRQGAEALQASAIAQLEAFMLGKYGEQFMQPAFLLIHAIWESIITQQHGRYIDDKDFEDSLEQLHKNPIISALNKALTSASGNHLRLFESNLLRLNLKSLRSVNYLNLAGLNLNGIDLSFASFKDSNLIAIDLSYAKIKNAILRDSNLYKANLFSSDLTNVDLAYANLTYAKCFGAIFQNTSLIGANLHGANLREVFLKEAYVSFAKINRETLFGDDYGFQGIWNNEDKRREEVLEEGAIWDDDPEWLEEKIQNVELLKSIKKYGQKRNPDGTFNIN